MLNQLQAYTEMAKILENYFQLPKLISFNATIQMETFLLKIFLELS